jgi:hypothetical protein
MAMKELVLIVLLAIGPFSAAMNYMSEKGYTRYLNHVKTGQWTAVK